MSEVRAERGSADLGRKIVELPRLLAEVEQARRAGKTIVQCHGCFDIVHPGHIRYLQFARKQGELLIVSLTGDSQMEKGPSRPYIPQELRAENLAALELVDYVLIDPHPTAVEVLKAVRPDVYVKGHEYQHSADPGFLQERHVVESYGGRVIFSSGEVVFSSTKLIEQMAGRMGSAGRRLESFCARHGIYRPVVAELLGRLAGKRVVVVGDTIVDKYVVCDVEDVASESPMLSLRHLDERSYVGGAAIVARHVAGLGGVAFLVTALGQDEASEQVVGVLERAGIEHHVLRVRSSVVQKMRFLADETKLFKVDRGETCPLDSVAERAAASAIIERASQADAIIWCDFGYGTITDGLWGRVGEQVGEQVGIVAADVSGTRGDLLRFAGVDLLCPTERELRAAMHDFESGLSSVAWRCLRRTGVRQLFVTLGKRGMVSFERQAQDPSAPGWSGRLRSEHLPALADGAVDRLGCGDALLAAAVLAMSAGASLAQAAYLGSAAAAVEIGRVGNVPVDVRSLADWLAERDELIPPAGSGKVRRIRPAVSAGAAGAR